MAPRYVRGKTMNLTNRNHFLYGITVIIGVCVVVGILLLWFSLRSTEPVQDVERLGEGTKESLPPAVVANDLPSVTNTPILTLTQTPLSLVQEVITPTIAAPIYLLANESITTTEVWKFSPDDGQWSMLHSISKAIDKPEDVIIPPEEIERMENYIKTLSPPPDVPAGSLFKRYPRYLVLSPTIK